MTDIDNIRAEYFGGEPNATTLDQLGQWIAESPDHARVMALESLIVSELRRRGGRAVAGAPPENAKPGLRVAPDTVANPPAHRENATHTDPSWWPWKVVLAASAACAVAAAGLFATAERHGPAILVAELGAVWEGEAPTASGFEPRRVYRLQAGLAHVKTESGASLIFEGPCQLAVTGDNAALLGGGKLAARCITKQTHGFTVTTPAGRVVDLGTEFGVEHNARGTFAYVLDGEVQVFASGPSGEATRVVRAGDAVRLSTRGTVVMDEAGWAPDFVTVSDFRVAAARASGSVTAAWAGCYDRLRSDLDLVFWTDFDTSPALGPPTNLCRYADDRNKLLPNDAIELVSGRLGENEALRRGAGDAIPQVRAPGVFRSLTLAAWVRLDQAAEGQATRHRALLLSDWSLPGSLHWQLKGDALRLTYPRGDSKPHAAYSARLPEAAGSGWRLFATVVQTGSRGAVRHFVDGQLIGEQPIVDATLPLRLGDCGIGGWQREGDERTLGGLIDDLMIWRRPLANSEITQLFEDGRAPTP